MSAAFAHHIHLQYPSFLISPLSAVYTNSSGDGDSLSSSSSSSNDSQPIHAYERSHLVLPVISAAPRERFLRYLPKLDRLAVVERNTFRLLDPATLRERVVRSGGGGPVQCANEIVALEHCHLGSASDRQILAVATQRHLLLYQVGFPSVFVLCI